MKLYHATPLRNVESILTHGLLCRKSRGKRQVVWGVSLARVGWAIGHVYAKQPSGRTPIVVLEFDVPRGWLRKHGNRLWYSVRDVPADRIRVSHHFEEIR